MSQEPWYEEWAHPTRKEAHWKNATMGRPGESEGAANHPAETTKADLMSARKV